MSEFRMGEAGSGAGLGAGGLGESPKLAGNAGPSARASIGVSQAAATDRRRAPAPGPQSRSFRPFLWVIAALMLAFATTASAQSSRIQIEVLVFAYNNPDSGSALSPADADPVYSGMLLGEGGTVYSALPRELLKLGGAYDALARNARTRALLHVGWQQDAGSTRAVRLRGRGEVRSSDPERGALATANPELDGDLRLRFGRGVEVHVDALLRVESRLAGRANGEQRFRLNSKRIVNYGELHYIDHPALGIIVRVDRVDDAGADATGSP